MASEGAYPIPPGVVANFINPPSLLHGHIALHTVFLTLDTIFLGIRLYTRKVIHRRLGLDDYVIVLAYLCIIAFSTLNLVADKNMLGRHMWDFPFTRQNWINAMRPFLIGVYPYILAAATVKSSCLLFYRHIFSSSRKTMQFINAGIVFILMAYTAMFFSESFECIPIQKLWDPFIPGGHCFSPKIQTYTNAAINTLTDVCVLLLPIPALWGLPLAPWRKFRVMAVFGLGLGATITSIVRLAVMPKMYSDVDVTWNMSAVGIWSVIEVNVGFLCSCLLVLPAFLKRHLPPGFRSKIARLLPLCFGQRSNESTNKTYLSGSERTSAYSHSNGTDMSSLYVPDFSEAACTQTTSATPKTSLGTTTLITSENANDPEGQSRKESLSPV
ncbi:hypothetical protein LSUE1_G000084 [Lachnellula suecica]|uniref:Rhodopsin domain-containing protein n=1 Tax=Lachnellula suecica TaxID=602035 RepID=A0A8T9CN05_9HELO|nr:hypothetical protein LSUE1_G000084 [Lachnellula suecica]